MNSQTKEDRLFELFKDLASDWYINPVGNTNTDFLEEKMAYWLRDNYTEHFAKLIKEEKIKELEDLPSVSLHDAGYSYGDYSEIVELSYIKDRIKELGDE